MRPLTTPPANDLYIRAAQLWSNCDRDIGQPIDASSLDTDEIRVLRQLERAKLAKITHGTVPGYGRVALDARLTDAGVAAVEACYDAHVAVERERYAREEAERLAEVAACRPGARIKRLLARLWPTVA